LTVDVVRAPRPVANGWRTFLVVWATQSFSLFGTALTTFALTIWLSQVVYPGPSQQQPLSLSLSVVGLSAFAPLLAAVPVAGTWVDRHDRRRTMIVANLACGAANLALAGLIAAGVRDVRVVVAPLVLISIGTAFHDAGLDASYRMLVSKEQLGRANGMMQTALFGANILAPGVAATLISLPALARRGVIPGWPGAALGLFHDGTVLAIGADGATFLCFGVVLLFLTIPSPARRDLAGEGRPQIGFWRDTLTGVRFIWQRRGLLVLLAAFMVANFIGFSRLVLLPMIVKFNLAADWRAHSLSYQAALAILTSLVSVGGIAGGLFMSAWGGLKRAQALGVLVPMMLSGVAQAVYGMSRLFLLSAAMTLVFSTASPILNAHSQSIWQTNTPPEMQGRVFAVRRLVAQGTGPVGLLIAGLLGGLANPGYVMTVLGLLLVVACGLPIVAGWWRLLGSPSRS
jgi:MFS family permease